MSDIVQVEKVLMFVDLHNFSVVSARLGTRTPDFIQAFYVLVGDAVVSRGGQLIKYLGDAVFACFDEGEELAAVNAGLEIRERYSDLAGDFGVGDITEAELGIGGGMVGFGTYGHPSLRVTDISGEAVNEAAVIMHHRGVAVTRSVYEAVVGHVQCGPISPFQAKWRDTPIERWEVTGPK